MPQLLNTKMPEPLSARCLERAVALVLAHPVLPGHADLPFVLLECLGRCTALTDMSEKNHKCVLLAKASRLA